MNALIRYRYHIIAALILLTILLMGARTKTSHVSHSASELPKVHQTLQQEQAVELFSQPNAGMALNANYSKDQRRTLLNMVRKSLPTADQSKAFEIAHSVISEANHHGMDPFFLLAVITTESHFNIRARGTSGEVGLMQVRPETARWFAAQAGLPEKYNLEDPAINIRIGATYMAFLRHSFHRKGKRYIAAYNMGATNVRRLIAQQTEPAVYPARVINNYEQIYMAIAASAPHYATRGVASIQRGLASVE